MLWRAQAWHVSLMLHGFHLQPGTVFCQCLRMQKHFTAILHGYYYNASDKASADVHLV